MAEPSTITVYRSACVTAIQAAITSGALPPYNVWTGLTVFGNQRYHLRGPGGGIAGTENKGTLNLALDREQGGEWAGGIPYFPGFGLTAELFLPVVPASGVAVLESDWATAETRAGALVAALRALLEGIKGSAGVAGWVVDYSAGSLEGGVSCVAALIRWRSTEG